MDLVLSLVIGIGSAFGASVIGGILTVNTIDGWYRTLKKPSWTPPDWVFGPVWLILYLLMGISLALILVKSDEADILVPVALFSAQLALNIAWNWFFFAKRMLRGGFIEIAAMWVLILLTTASFVAVDLVSAVLLVPYLAWVSIASLLNYRIWRMNPGKPTV